METTYWIETCSSMLVACGVLVGLGGIGTIVGLGTWLGGGVDGGKILFSIALPIFLLALVGCVFIPTPAQARRIAGIPEATLCTQTCEHGHAVVSNPLAGARQ